MQSIDRLRMETRFRSVENCVDVLHSPRASNRTRILFLEKTGEISYKDMLATKYSREGSPDIYVKENRQKSAESNRALRDIQIGKFILLEARLDFAVYEAFRKTKHMPREWYCFHQSDAVIVEDSESSKIYKCYESKVLANSVSVNETSAITPQEGIQSHKVAAVFQEMFRNEIIEIKRSFQEKLDSALRNIKDLKRENDRLKQENKQVKQNVESIQKELESSEGRLNRHRKTLDDLMKYKNEGYEIVEVLNNKNEKTDKKIEETKEEMHALAERLKAIENVREVNEPKSTPKRRKIKETHKRSAESQKLSSQSP